MANREVRTLIPQALSTDSTDDRLDAFFDAIETQREAGLKTVAIDAIVQHPNAASVLDARKSIRGMLDIADSESGIKHAKKRRHGKL